MTTRQQMLAALRDVVCHEGEPTTLTLDERQFPYLLWADWLESYSDDPSDHDRAEMIRLACEMERMSHADKPCATRRAAIVARQEEMIGWNHDHAKQLAAYGVPVWATTEMFDDTTAADVSRRSRGVMSIVFPSDVTVSTRGVVTALRCDWDYWSEHGDTIMERQPVVKVRLTTRPSLDDHLSQRWPGVEFELPAQWNPTIPVGEGLCLDSDYSSFLTGITSVEAGFDGPP